MPCRTNSQPCASKSFFKEKWIVKSTREKNGLIDVLRNLDKNLEFIATKEFKDKHPNSGFLGFLELFTSNELINNIYLRLDKELVPLAMKFDGSEDQINKINEIIADLNPKIEEFLKLMERVQQGIPGLVIIPVDQSELVTPVEATKVESTKSIENQIADIEKRRQKELKEKSPNIIKYNTAKKIEKLINEINDKYDAEIAKLKENQVISKNEITENNITQLDDQTIVEDENQQQEPKNKNILDILNKSKYSFLSEILKNIETELAWTKNNDVNGFYYLGKNKIEIGEHMLFSDHLEQTIAHEAIHAIIDEKTKGTEKRKEKERKRNPLSPA